MNDISNAPGALDAGRIAGLLVVTAILGGGQLLFKLAASRLVLGQGPLALALSFANLPMFTALLLYAGATVLWVYLLHGMPLSRAYPFVALAFAVVPLLSWMVFRDSLDLRYGFGLALMLGGLYLVASGR